MRDPAAAFSATYAEARARFLAAAGARGLVVESHVHPDARGAEGEALAMDVAVAGPQASGALLVLTSAMHGAEGFSGSGCQVALLEDDAWAAAVAQAGVAVVYVHAVNPHGFSHLARTNESNVDLNRNFRDFSLPIPRNEAYLRVDPLLVPADWPPPAANEAALQALRQELGERAVQAAITGGQCDRPDGLFFGGKAPAWSNLILRAVFTKYGAQRRRIAWIDFHTGLGPPGHGERIHMGDGDDASIDRARRMYGVDVTSYHDGSSTSAPISGVSYRAAVESCPRAEFTGIALEFGTLPLKQVIDALRGDAWLLRHPDAPADKRAAIKRAVRDAFYVDRPDWKAMLVGQARATALQALKGLST